MASPFRTFRKNQKTWMAAITIMAIIAFVFLSNPAQFMGGRSGGGMPPVVRTKFGNLTQPEVINQRSQRVMLQRFLRVLEAQFRENQPGKANTRAFASLLGDDSEQTAIDRWVYARTAESMGVVVDDKAVNELLSLLCAGLPEPQKMISDILSQDRQGMTQAMLIDFTRQQLLALRLTQIGHQYDDWAGNSATPGERWDYFKRFNQKASVDVALLRPESFVNEVKDPSAEELKGFFEQCKAIESSPDSPKPGFLVPRMVSIEYLEADSEKHENAITEDEITQEYAKDPKKYARDEEAFKEEYEKEKAARAKDDAKAAPKSSAAPVIKPETAPAKPAPKPETNSPTKPEANSAPAPAKPVPTAKPAPTATKPAGNSAVRPASPFRLVAYATEKPADSSGHPAAAVKKDSAAVPAMKTEEKKAADVAKPTEVKPAPTKPAAAQAAPDDGKKESTAKSEAAKKEKKPIKTAEERLRDMIRKELARKKFDENTAKIKGLLESYRSELLAYQEAVKANPELPKPAKPDFAALAKQYNMTANRTGLVSKRRLAETELGKSVQTNPETMQNLRTIEAIFVSPGLHKMEVAYSAPYFTRQYIFWKVDDQPGGVPNWKDAGVETKVRHEWKLVQAREKALKAADALKAQAAEKGNAGKPLKDLVGKEKNVEVVEPPKFTWMTIGMMTQGIPKISDVGDLKYVGADFMQTVFGLSEKEPLAVTTNIPKSEVYVIRLNSLTSFQDLWSEFTAEDTPRDYDYVLRFDIGREVSKAWRDEVLRKAGYKREELKQTERQSAPEAPEGPPPPEEF